MPPAQSRVAIDVSGSLIRVLEGTMGGPMRCGSLALPDGAANAGKVVDPSAVAQALRELLARTEIVDSRALVALSDSIATTRVLSLPEGSTDRDVAAAVAKTLPVHEPERIATQWTDVSGTRDHRVVYAVAWDRAQLKSVTDALEQARIEPSAIELKSLAVARTLSEPSCIVVDLTSKPVEVTLVDQHIPRIWHSFEMDEWLSENAGAALAGQVRSVLRYHGRGRDLDPADSSFPVLVAVDQGLPASVADEVARLVGQPVRPVAAPPRVAANVRHSTYLACLGLIMRRG